MAKQRDAAVNVPRAVIARLGVTGTKAKNPRAALPQLKDITDNEALIPDALAVRVAKGYATDADLFREVAACVLQWARVFNDSGKKKATNSIKHARVRAEKARDMVDFALGSGVIPGRPTAAQWATLVEAAIHAGSAFSLSVDHHNVRRPQARTASRKSRAKGDATREAVRAAAEDRAEREASGQGNVE